MTTTVYDLKITANMSGNAGAGLDALASRADRAARSTSELSGLLGKVGAVLGGAALFGGAKEAFIGFNASMEKLQIGMGAIIQMNLGGTFEDARSAAAGLFKEFQDFAVKSPLTTKEVAEFGNNIAAAVFSTGGSMKEFINLTEQGAIAAQTLGFNAEIAGIQMQEMLQGRIVRTARFSQQLMGATLARHGLTREDYGKLKPAEQRALLSEALNDSALVKARGAFEKSFVGETSTLKDRIQIALGQVGLPLFKAVTKEIASWNAWIVKNSAKLEAFGRDVGQNLIAAFSMLKDVGSFLIANKDTIKLIAEIAIGLKVAKFGASLAEGVVGVVSSFAKVESAGGLLAQVIGGSGFGLVGVIGGAIAFIAGYMAKREMEDRAKKAPFMPIAEADIAFRGSNRSQEERAKLAETVIKNLQSNEKQIFGKRGLSEAQLTSFYQNPAALADQIVDKMGYVGKEMADVSNGIIDAMKLFNNPEELKTVYKALFQQAAAEGTFDPNKAGAPSDRGTQMNVRIDKIEVVSDDPDRIAYGLEQSFENAIRNPTQAERMIRTGI